MKLQLKNPTTGILETAPIGISWTTLLFCPIPALCRSDWKWCAIQFLLVCIAPILTNIIFADQYNKIYLRALLEKGFKVVSVEGGTWEDAQRKTKVDLPKID